MNSSLPDLGMYCGESSIYQAMEKYASIVYPTESKGNPCYDNISNTLLNTMIGLPHQEGFHLRVFMKFVAANTLANHLSGNKVDMPTARKIHDQCRNVYFGIALKALPPHK